MIKTSRNENIPFRILGGFRMRSVYISFIVFAITAIITNIFQVFEFISGPVSAVIFLTSGIIAFIIVEKLHGGKYPLENCEKLLAKMQLSQKMFNLESVKEANVEVKYNKFDAHSISEYDKDSWYLPTSEEIIGIKIVEIGFNNTTGGKILFSESRFEAFCSALLQIVPTQSSIKFVSPNVIDHDCPEHMKSKKIMRGDYFIFIRLPVIIGMKEKKQEIIKLINSNFVRMTPSEMSEVTEKIFFPYNSPSKKEKPVFRSGFSFEKGFVKGVWFGIETAVITLVQLPAYVDERFQIIYTALSDITSTISVTVHPVKFETPVSSFIKEKIKVKKGIKNENEDAQKLQHDEINCFFQISIMLHGSPEQIAQKFSEIESICIRFGESNRPIFGQDTAFVSDAMKSFLPGSEPRIPFRRQKIKNITEIIYYLPRPKFSKKVENPDLNLRTIDNRLFQIKFTAQYPTAYISPPGSGKSLYLSLSILSHIRKKKLNSVGGCYIEIGMSFKFLCQEGLADAWLTLVKEADFLPLEDHPLRAFFSFGAMGREAATEWICELCSIDYDKESAVAADVREIIKSCNNEKVYSLEIFYNLFEKTFIEKASSDEKWLDRIQNLKNFVDPNVFGKIFVPKETRNFAWENARFIYFSTSSTKVTQPKKLYGAYFSMAISLSEMLCEKHTSKQLEPLEMQFVVDEIHAARDSIPQKKLRIMNSQGRKDGMRSEFATQELTDLVIDSEDEKKKFGIIATTRRLFFKENPGDLVSYMLKSSSDLKNKLERIEYVSKSNLELMSEGRYAWGYIDENREIHQVILDVNKVDLWASTTHAGSIAIRQACLRTGLYDYWTTCELLAKRGPVELPQFIPPDEEIQKIVTEVIRNPNKNLSDLLN
ncbi:hypothetical protein [Fluviispira sanaruensis]|uniref:Uncharacterized protein n=1 Tax=Fluviispira sanaruensis TaxID=2493639 RepID=A0A4P2VNV7_FLUSA|nr:hypothetical protein [Fluviispira sanaruensis]BBH54628.1 hypothetical protein JCM31447_31020 [Fluviispira sanaruensis]